MKTLCAVIAAFAALGTPAAATTAAAVASPRTQLKEAVAQLQKTPGDTALREKIIGLARRVKPAPAIPEEARKNLVQAVALQKDAKSPSDFDEVISHYDQALLAAPWWGDAYYNLSTADEAAGRLDAAVDALKLFIATKPKAEDARQAQDRLYVLEAKLEKAGKEKAAADAAARAEQEKYGWALGQWSLAADGCNGHCRYEGVVEGRKTGDLIELRWTQGSVYLGNNPPNSWSNTWEETKGFIKGTISPSGGIEWEALSDSAGNSCPTAWLPANLDISADHGTISYTQQKKFYQSCRPSGQDRYVLTHR